SSTTRLTRSGAWTSRLRQRRSITARAEHCSRLSTSHSGSKRISSGEDEHGRARAASRQDRKEIRGNPSPTEGNDPQPPDFPGGTRSRPGEIAINASRCEPVASAQSLRYHGSLARCVPQVRPVPREDPRGRLPRRDSGSVQGELVRTPYEHD